MDGAIKLELKGETVFVCCKGCGKKRKADPEQDDSEGEGAKSQGHGAAVAVVSADRPGFLGPGWRRACHDRPARYDELR